MEAVLIILAAIIVVVDMLLGIYQNRFYMIPLWKLIIAIVLMMLSGLLGISLLYYVEYGVWGGKSFFGCILLTPIVILFVSKILKVPTNDLMDIAGPICAAFLAVIKINCLDAGCCEGIVLKVAADGAVIRFPSQIIEGVNGAIICAVLLFLQRKEKYRRRLAPMFLMLYGCTRFVLNFFRDHLWSLDPFEKLGLFVPRGHFWAFICIVWGAVWYILLCRKKKLTEHA